MIEFRTLGGLDLRGAPGETLHSLAAQPKRLALLAYLCVAAPRGFHRRDTLLALFWPESDQAHARTSLRNAVHVLRRALGAEAVLARGDEELAIDFQRVWCDAVAVDEVAADGRAEDVVTLYRGDFLAGFFIRDAPEWERWVDGERARLRTHAAQMARVMAERSETEGNITEAVRCARRAVELTGDDERAFRGLLELFDRVGDRAGALHAYEEFTRRLRTEYGAEPALETSALADRIRTRGQRSSNPSAVPQAEMVAIHEAAAMEDHQPSLSRGRRLFRMARTRRGAAAVVAIFALGLTAALLLARSGHAAHRSASPYRIAVFPFRVLGDTGWKFLHEGAMDLLSGAIDGVGELRRVDPIALTSRMRREGQTEVDQELARRISAELGAGRYVLGTVVGESDHASMAASLYDTYRDAEPMAVAQAEMGRDSMSRRVMGLARDLLRDQRVGEGDRSSQFGSIHAKSYFAERAYFRGEAMLRRGVYDSAVFAYEQAVREDSAFALAWYRLAITRGMAGGTNTDIVQSIDTAMRLRHRLARHDRLLVESLHAYLHGDGRRAEERALEAVTAYPDEMEAWLALGTTQWWHAWQMGRSPAVGLQALDRALALDPDSREALHLSHILSLYERRYADATSLAERAYSPQGPLAYNRTSAKAVDAFARGDTAAQLAALAELKQSGEFAIFQSAAFVAAFTDNIAGARRIAALMTESSSRSASAQARGHVMLALLELAGGARHAARTEFDRAAAFDTTLTFIYGGIMAAVPEFGFAEDDVRAIHDATLRWRPTTRESNIELPWLFKLGAPTTRFRQYALGLLATRLGDDSAALSYAKALAGAHEPSDSAGLLPDLALEIRALVAARAGDTSAALASLEREQLRVLWHYQVMSPLHERPVGRFLRAEMLHARGRDTEALGWYNSLTSLSMIEFVFLAPAYLRQGQIYESARQPARAVEYYSRFVARWQTCDPELRPLVDDARRRIARLSGGQHRRVATPARSPMPARR
jgi:serine/threonine-protein kinase